MIFGENSTLLGDYSGTIPMAEGYDANTGFAFALIESAKNDLTVMTSIIECDTMELALNKGFVQEAQFKETVKKAATSAWNRVVALFEKLVAKIKGIYASVVAKLSKVFSSDAALVKKYASAVKAKNLSDMEGKFCDVKASPTFDSIALVDLNAKGLAEIVGGYAEDKTTMIKNFLGKSKEEFKNALHSDCFGEEKTGKFSEFKLSIDDTINYLQKGKAAESALRKKAALFEKSVAGIVKQAKANAKKAEKDNKDEAMKAVAAASAYSEACLWSNKCLFEQISYEHKLYRSVFTKAMSYKEKKAEETTESKEESAFYESVIDTLLEADVEDAVTNAITSALTGEDISDVSAAEKDNGQSTGSKDPNKNTYDKTDCYTAQDEPPVAGTVKSCVNSRCESVNFGELLY